MKQYLAIVLVCVIQSLSAQNVGIVRENYFSSYYDSTFMMLIDVLDSSTVRLGSINPVTGLVSYLGSKEYNTGINLTGATIDPYLNHYYIGKGPNLLTFDISTGDIINDVLIYGALPPSAFQNFRFNHSDSTLYGMVPQNFYSSYYDSSAMMVIQVLDSTQIRFASLDPITGQYTLIGSTSFDNLYTLAGNSIDPYQMLFYYSAVDTLIGIDLYTGSAYSAVPIQLPPYGIFENIAYSCADTAIYGMVRQNYVSMAYDTLFMDTVEVVDSTTFKLSKIDPNTGAITLISPKDLGAGGNLTGGAFIDPNAMVYYFSNGNQIVGVSMVSGLVTSTATKNFPSNAIAFDMMRSTQNCFGATKVRLNNSLGVDDFNTEELAGSLYPNPAQQRITVEVNAPIVKVEVVDMRGSLVLEGTDATIQIDNLPNGIYCAKVFANNGRLFTAKFVKN